MINLKLMRKQDAYFSERFTCRMVETHSYREKAFHSYSFNIKHLLFLKTFLYFVNIHILLDERNKELYTKLIKNIMLMYFILITPIIVCLLGRAN